MAIGPSMAQGALSARSWYRKGISVFISRYQPPRNNTRLVERDVDASATSLAALGSVI